VPVLVPLIGGLFAEALGSALGLLAVVTGLLTVGARSSAALTAGKRLRSDALARRLERATAVGFFVGFALGTLILVLDAAVGA
jgi:hypothetical protein